MKNRNQPLRIASLILTVPLITFAQTKEVSVNNINTSISSTREIPVRQARPKVLPPSPVNKQPREQLLQKIKPLLNGGSNGGGGDICENRIQTIRNDITSWILQGGSSKLELPASVTLEEYNKKMLAELPKAHIVCTDETIFVGRAVKTCKNFIDEETNQKYIACNIKRLTEQTNESDQYVLIHHEYASFAGLEPHDGEVSDYKISNQISGHLEEQLVKKLVVKQPEIIYNRDHDPALLRPIALMAGSGDYFSLSLIRETEFEKTMKGLFVNAGFKVKKSDCFAVDRCVTIYTGKYLQYTDNAYNARYTMIQFFKVDGQGTEMTHTFRTIHHFSGLSAREFHEILKNQKDNPSVKQETPAWGYKETFVVSAKEGLVRCSEIQSSPTYSCMLIMNH